MTEETGQPGGRSPAPGSLALVQDFLNTHYDLAGEGTELLSSPDALKTWLTVRELLDDGARPTPNDLRRCLAVREGLRALALVNNGRPTDRAALAAMDRAGAGASLGVRVSSGSPRLDRHPGVDGALGLLLGLTAEAMLLGGWGRLKACPGDHCGWAFYDTSRNQAGRWCSMSVCGGRSKARAYYRRRTGGGG